MDLKNLNLQHISEDAIAFFIALVAYGFAKSKGWIPDVEHFDEVEEDETVYDTFEDTLKSMGL